MKKRLQKIVAVLLSVSLVAFSGCGDEDKKLTVADFEGPWVDSDLMDVITENDEFRLQDDFAAAVNKDWKLQQTRIRPALSEINEAVLAKKKRVIEDTSITGAEADRLRTFYSLATDWDGRNEDGLEPLAAYIRTIDGLSDTQDLYKWMQDETENPLALGVVCVKDTGISVSTKYTDKYRIELSYPGLSLPDSTSYLDMKTSDFEAYERLKEEAGYLLGRMGYSKADADRIVTDALLIEKEIAKTEITDPDIKEENITYSRQEVLDMAGDYPLDEYLKAWGYTDIDVIVATKALLKKASKLCTGADFERIKSYFMIRYLMEGYKFTDREAHDTIEAMSKSKLKKPEPEIYTPEEKEEQLIYDTYLCQTPMVGAMSKLYAENCYDDSATEELRHITESIIDKYHKVFNEEDWLSDEGKKACIEKLDAISIHVVYQDYDSVDYSKLELASREEGGSFLEAYMQTRRFKERHKAEIVSKPYDRNYWDPLETQVSTTVTNAMYSAQTNGIYILAGICEAPAYTPDMTYEQKLAGIGTIIGHEITHGFDSNGSQYDKDGVKNPWLPDEDMTAFNDKVSRVSNYFFTLTPYPGAGMYDGSQVEGEETADMGGMKVTLELAADVDGFDYDRYFRSYADLWKSHVPLSYERQTIKTDVHPLDFYRINIGMQQFDEFYETYGIKEGDGMYIDPAKRISVW